MKIYDLISHRSYEVQSDWIDFERSKKDPDPIVSFSTGLTKIVFHRIFLKNEFRKNTPNNMGILAVTKKVYENILNQF